MSRRFCFSVRLPLFFLAFIALLPVNVLASDWLYSFRPGDTIWSVCNQYTNEPNCWQKLGALNNIDADRRIAPGTRIKIPTSWLKVPPASATIFYVQGDAYYELFGEPVAVARKGVKLPIGSILKTDNGTATLLFADGSSMVLEANSELELDTLSNFELNGMVDSTVRLSKGTLRTRVIEREPRSQFRTITPSAVAVVRGTEYRVDIVADEPKSDLTAQEKTLVSVYQGLVDVGAEKTSYPVPASFGIVTKQGEPPKEPVKLLAAPAFVPFKQQNYVTFNSLELQSEAVAIDWDDLPDAAAYQLVVVADLQAGANSADQQIQSYVESQSEAAVIGLALGCYRLRLRAIDQQGLHGLAAEAPLCVEQRIASPEAIVQEIEILGAPVRWSEIPEATSYRIEVSDNENFTTLLDTITTQDVSVSFEYDKQIYWRVKAVGDGDQISLASPSYRWHPSAEEDYWALLVPIGLFVIGLILI